MNHLIDNNLPNSILILAKVSNLFGSIKLPRNEFEVSIRGDWGILWVNSNVTTSQMMETEEYTIMYEINVQRYLLQRAQYSEQPGNKIDGLLKMAFMH
jgi:hypothetical protein